MTAKRKKSAGNKRRQVVKRHIPPPSDPNEPDWDWPDFQIRHDTPDVATPFPALDEWV